MASTAATVDADIGHHATDVHGVRTPINYTCAYEDQERHWTPEQVDAWFRCDPSGGSRAKHTPVYFVYDDVHEAVRVRVADPFAGSAARVSKRTVAMWHLVHEKKLSQMPTAWQLRQWWTPTVDGEEKEKDPGADEWDANLVEAPMHTLSEQQRHTRNVCGEKMSHIEQCIKIVGDSTINAFDHVRIGRILDGLVSHMERGELGLDECERLCDISASYDRLVVTFVSPLHHRRGRPRKQARTYRRGKPDARMQPTELRASDLSDRSRMDAQSRPRKGEWPTFYCKACPRHGRPTPSALPYGTLSCDVMCDACMACAPVDGDPDRLVQLCLPRVLPPSEGRPSRADSSEM